MLQTQTETKRQKAIDSVMALGSHPSRVYVNSENRGHVKTWLNGLGLEATIYAGMSLSVLEKCYRSAFEGNGAYLKAIVRNREGSDYEQAEIVARALASFASAGYELDGVAPVEVSRVEVSRVETPVEVSRVETPDVTAVAGQLAALLANGGGLTEARVVELIQANRPQTKITISTPDKPDYDLDDEPRHPVFSSVLSSLSVNHDVALVGPAGSGKTHLCIQAAKALGRDYEISGAVSQEYKLVGFRDANGETTVTNFRRAFRDGKLMILDEFDACNPNAVLTINAALSSRVMDFPDGTYEAHKDFVCIACMNTFGRGADRKYVGRNRLDAATNNRFDFVEMNYDEVFERQISPNDEWTSFVQRVRRAVEKLGEDYIVSPRASIRGAALLAAGDDREVVINKVVRQGMPEDVWSKVQGAM